MLHMASKEATFKYKLENMFDRDRRHLEFLLMFIQIPNKIQYSKKKLNAPKFQNEQKEMRHRRSTEMWNSGGTG